MRSSSTVVRFICLSCRLREAGRLPNPSTIHTANLSTNSVLLWRDPTPVVELSPAQTFEVRQLSQLRKRLASGITTPTSGGGGTLSSLTFDEAIRALPAGTTTNGKLLRRLGEAYNGRGLSDVLPELDLVSRHRGANSNRVRDPLTQVLLRELGITDTEEGSDSSQHAATNADVPTGQGRVARQHLRKGGHRIRTAIPAKSQRAIRRVSSKRIRRVTADSDQGRAEGRRIGRAYRATAARPQTHSVQTAEGTTELRDTTVAVGRSRLSSSAPSKESINVSQSTVDHDAIAKLTEGKLETLNAQKLAMRALDYGQPLVPTLSFDLQRVLFNPGVYQLQDQRSGVYNFDPYLERIMPISEFNFDALNGYITSSEDKLLSSLAKQNRKKYVGSSSSMSGAMSHFHFLLSQYRTLSTDNLSNTFRYASREFTNLTRCPSALFLRHKHGVYAVDADKEFDSANILMELGKSMEKLLTMPKDKFEKLRKDRPLEELESPEENLIEPEAYHYCEQGDFLLRSQLDAHDPRLPGTGMFDLKTRAVISIRMNVSRHEEGIGYEIRSRYGEYESYEREYYDMIRNAFLKYSLQVRMGRMDGIFVAYHNIERMFGFQYIPLPEMDLALHGQEDRCLGDQEFKLSVQLLNVIFNQATAKFPQKSLRFHFETRQKTTQEPTPYLLVFAEPYEEAEIVDIQNSKKEVIAELRRRMLNPTPPITNASSEISLMSDIDLDDPADETDLLNRLNTAPEDPPKPTTSSTATLSGTTNRSATPSATHTRPFFAAALRIRNLVNGRPVPRPVRLSRTDDWTVEYTLTEYGPTKGRDMLTACKNRRKSSLQKLVEANEASAASSSNKNGFLGKFKRMSEAGAAWRREQDRVFDQQGGERKVLYADRL